MNDLSLLAFVVSRPGDRLPLGLLLFRTRGAERQRQQHDGKSRKNPLHFTLLAVSIMLQSFQAAPGLRLNAPRALPRAARASAASLRPARPSRAARAYRSAWLCRWASVC